MQRLVALLCLLCASLASEAAGTTEPDTPGDAAPRFFQTYCVRCHDARKQEGMFRLDALSRDFADQAVGLSYHSGAPFRKSCRGHLKSLPVNGIGLESVKSCSQGRMRFAPGPFISSTSSFPNFFANQMND